MTVRYFSDRPRRDGRRGGANLLPLIVADLSRYMRDRYGETLTEDDAGRDDAFVMACHLSRTRRGDHAIRQWLALRAPWMDSSEVEQITSTAMRLQLRWTADKLAHRIGLDYETRVRLHITTIGAIDVPKDERLRRRAEKKRLAQEQRRRDRGSVSRVEYLSVSQHREKPWKAEGISRRTWYRARQRVAQGACPA